MFLAHYICYPVCWWRQVLPCCSQCGRLFMIITGLILMYHWSKDWSLSYNTNKCEVLRISRKRRSLLNLPTVNPYTIDGHPLVLVPSTKDLRVVVNNKLTWSLHISSAVAKANKTLGFLNRQFSFSFIGPSHRKSLYLTLVRSDLSYASEIWAPQSCIRDMKL